MNKRLIKTSTSQRIDSLQHDCEQLYYLIGAISDCMEKLPYATRLYFIELMQQKARRADKKFRDTLQTYIEALQP